MELLRVISLIPTRIPSKCCTTLAATQNCPTTLHMDEWQHPCKRYGSCRIIALAPTWSGLHRASRWCCCRTGIGLRSIIPAASQRSVAVTTRNRSPPKHKMAEHNWGGADELRWPRCGIARTRRGGRGGAIRAGGWKERRLAVRMKNGQCHGESSRWKTAACPARFTHGTRAGNHKRYRRDTHATSSTMPRKNFLDYGAVWSRWQQAFVGEREHRLALERAPSRTAS